MYEIGALLAGGRHDTVGPDHHLSLTQPPRQEQRCIAAVDADVRHREVKNEVHETIPIHVFFVTLALARRADPGYLRLVTGELRRPPAWW